MKSYSKVIMVAVLFFFVAVTCWAEQTLKQYDGIKGRSYHADFYDGKSCDSCHTNKKPLNLPEDDACLECHDQDELVQSTSRPDKEEKWQNPHNNMHYGKDVPCMECHGEHSSRKHMCDGCHTFKYTKFNE